MLALARPDASFAEWWEHRKGKPSFLMICHDQTIDRRIVQQAVALQRTGWAGLIIGLSSDQEDIIEQADGVPVHKVGLKHIVPDCPVYWRMQNRARLISNFGRLVAFFSNRNFSHYLRGLKRYYQSSDVYHPLPFDQCFYDAGSLYQSDMVVAHDLPALKAAAALSREWKARLVYDAHELYAEQEVFSPVHKRILEEREKEFLPKCDLVMTVSHSLADAMHSRYGIAVPEVIRNVTSAGLAGEVAGLRRSLRLPPDARIALYQGGVTRRRNLDVLLEGFLLLKDEKTHLVFLGPTEEPMLDKLRDLAGGLLGRRVHFHRAVPPGELLAWTTSADFGIVPYAPCDLNTKYCLPNKLFEYIQAGLPFVANEDLVEVGRLLKELGGGGLSGPMRTPAATAQSLEAMSRRDLGADRAFLSAARGRYSWDREKERYLALMENLRVKT
jgi:glycosyltransferase involved in cell wall biosynthesis